MNATRTSEFFREGLRNIVSQAPKEMGERMSAHLDAMETQLCGASLTDRRKAFLDELSKGELVYLPRYRQRVVVHKVDREKREVTVKLGGMKMKVGFDEVTWYETL